MSIWYVRHVNVNISVVCGNLKLQYIFFWCNFTFVEVEFSYLTALMILLMHKKTKVSVKYLRQSPRTWQKTSWCPVEDAHILSAESILEVSPTVSLRMWFHFTLTDVETQSWTAITAWQTCSRSLETTFIHIKCQTRSTQMGTSQWFLQKYYKPIFSGWLRWWTTRTLIVCSEF